MNFVLSGRNSSRSAQMACAAGVSILVVVGLSLHFNPRGYLVLRLTKQG